uniref:Selenoprotein H n=1 Tax=Rhizophora mucronata TaxID=61149 RepID=A0A2P2IPV2_RHIMU
MAPKKRKAQEESANPSAPTSIRMTRSAAQRVAKGSARPTAVQLPRNKKGKAAAAEKKAKAKDKAEEEEVDTVTEKVAEERKKEVEREEEQAEEETATGGGASKTIVIEHCKQCTSFKKRAEQVERGLRDAVPGITVLLNPDKPRKGCFEIREQGGETFISLLDMKRPFKPMKDLDMEEVILDVINKIKTPTQS